LTTARGGDAQRGSDRSPRRHESTHVVRSSANRSEFPHREDAVRSKSESLPNRRASVSLASVNCETAVLM
jgi:hypothetical protein